MHRRLAFARPQVFTRFQSSPLVYSPLNRRMSAATAPSSGEAKFGSKAAAAAAAALAVRPVPSVIRGVIFDMDGTLTVQGSIDFKRLRSRLGLADKPEVDVLSTLAVGTASEIARCRAIIIEEETIGAERCQLQPGYNKLFEYIESNKLPKALLTRNSLLNVNHFTKTHSVPTVFDPLVTRDSPYAYKPSPDPILGIAKSWSLAPNECLMVGDSRDDMLSGIRAGALTCLVLDDTNRDHVSKYKPHFVIERLEELIPILQKYSPAASAAATASGNSKSAAAKPSTPPSAL